MISYDFSYVKPTTINEAISQFASIQKLGKQAIYYNGGTELLSRARKNEIQFDALIDIKSIPECSTFHKKDGKLIIGSSVSLNNLTKGDPFPLLSNVIRKIATHTARNKITIGGHLMSALPYREAMMPFLLTESIVHVTGERGMRELPIMDLASSRAALAADEFIVHLETEEAMLQHPHVHLRKTKQSALNYPIVSLASIKHEEHIRFACSGLCTAPFRDVTMEMMISDDSLSVKQRIEKAVQSVRPRVIDDIQASKEYRLFLFKQVLHDMLHQIEGVKK